MIGMGIIGVLVVGLVSVIALDSYQTKAKEDRYNEQVAEAEREAEIDNEYRTAVVRELTDDIGKMIFRKMNQTFGLGRFSGSDLDAWDYQPIKKRYIMDLTVDWEGIISGAPYWVDARAYVHSDYVEKGNNEADVRFEIRSKSDSLIDWEQTVGGIAIGIGVIEVLSRQ